MFLYLNKISRLKNGSVFPRAMLFFIRFLFFRRLTLQVLQRMQVLNFFKATVMQWGIIDI